MRAVPRFGLVRWRIRLRPQTLILFAAALLAAPATAAASVERVETPIVSVSPQADVASSLVQLHVPLPAGAAPHPDACDWIQYVRFRSVTGPTDPMQADAVTVLMPGVMEGAMAFDPLARNAVREAKRRGRYIEVWALDRRSACLEDLTGLNRFEQTGNYKDATDYYYRGAAIDGKTFGGWEPDDRVLADIGMKQTMDDYYALLTNELPSQPWRERHVLCGGHSLGGPLTQMFAGWDFDGNKATTEDAGWRQCAAFVGFESMLDLDPTHDSKLLSGAINLITLGNPNFLRKVATPALRKGLIPRRLDISGADPISTAAIEMIGIAASEHPDESAAPMLAAIPHFESLDSYWHLAASADLGDLAFTKKSLRDLKYTNAGLLGQLFDDNGPAFTGMRASFGFFNGAPLRRNRITDQVNVIPGLNIIFQKGALMLPRKSTKNGPLAGWTNYDELGSGPTQIGAGLTNPGTEVTDARDFARIQYEGPTNFTEPFFPTRLMSDLAAFYIGDRGGDLSHFMYRHPTRLKPRMDALGGSGVAKKSGFGSPDPYVMMPGYEHVDAITAAEKQNNGQPEGSTKMLTDMIDRVVPR
jgi:pimeloyl-ACP methyl ester carboxylesterase